MANKQQSQEVQKKMNRWLQPGLSARLSLAMAQVVVVVLLAMGAGLIWIARDAEQESTAIMQQQRAEQVAVVISAYLNEAIENLRLFESLESLGEMTQAEQKRALETLLIERKHVFSQITLIDASGREQVKVSRTHTYLPDELGPTSHPEDFAGAMKGEPSVSQVYYSQKTGLLSVLIVVPLMDSGLNPVGALNAEVNLNPLWQDIGRIENGESGYAYIVDSEGCFIAHQELATVLQRYGEDMGGLPTVQDFMNGVHPRNVQAESYQGLNGSTVVGAYAPVEAANWAVIVELPEEEAYAGIFRMQCYSIILMFLAVLAALLSGTWMARRFVQPILDLTGTARQMSDGQLNAPVAGMEREDELGVLARTFDLMAGRMRQLITSLEQRVEELSAARAEQDRLGQLLQNMIDSMPSVLAGIDGKGRVTHWNTEAERITGLSSGEAIGKPVDQVLPVMRETMQELEKALAERTVQRFDRIACTVNGSQRFAEVIIYPIRAAGEEGAVVRIDDVTSRIRLQELMIQSEKMMSVGGLAAGMAHEINTPLGGILQGVQNLERRLAPDQDANLRVAGECGLELEPLAEYMEKRQLYEILDGIRQSGIRASRIVNNMLQFSRASGSERRLHNLAELLDNSVELASSDYDLKKHHDFRRIEIVRQYAEGMPEVCCSEMEIEQVILNILKNAAQAMGGMLERGLQPRIQLTTGLDSGSGMAYIEIADNGPGMDENTRRKVFEPFFTTKPPGEGTGLGLSVSYFIITSNHSGTITVDSSPGQGCRFTIKLPLGQ